MPKLLVKAQCLSLHISARIAVDFARLLSRICTVVNSPPQTLQRQPGEVACGAAGIDC